MQRETSNDSFLDYGSVYHQPIDHEHPELIHQTMVAITRRYVSQFYCFNCDTYLQVKSGIGILLVSHTAEAADVQEFAMNRLIHIRPNIYFAVVSTTQKLEYDLYAESSYSLHITDFPSQYEFLAVLPRIEIQKILGYYYRIRTENYCFNGERHDFFELTYVDTGELETEVDGTLCSCCSRTRWTSRPKSISTTRSWSGAVRCSSRTAIPSARSRCVWATAPSIISPSPST